MMGLPPSGFLSDLLMYYYSNNTGAKYLTICNDVLVLGYLHTLYFVEVFNNLRST
jgi:hypothetical protein